MHSAAMTSPTPEARDDFRAVADAQSKTLTRTICLAGVGEDFGADEGFGGGVDLGAGVDEGAGIDEGTGRLGSGLEDGSVGR